MATAIRERVLAVGLSQEECARVSGVCTGSEILRAGSVSQVRDLIRRIPNPGIDLLLVSAVEPDEQDALPDCLEMREREPLCGVPLLAVITRYQMDLGNDIRRLHHADYIFQPISEEELSRKLDSIGMPSAKKAGTEKKKSGTENSKPK